MKLIVMICALFMTQLASASLAGIANPSAKKGGTLSFNLGSEPSTLNPFSSSDYNQSQVEAYIAEALTSINPQTYENEPSLAESWTISDDGKVFEFTLREGVTWHDGKPFTVEDVKFTFDAILHPKNKYKTAHSKPYFENITKIEITGKNKIKFTAKNSYFGNFQYVASRAISPKHIYENPSEEKQKELNKTIIGTGPYIFDNFDRGKAITLKRNPNWWGDKISEMKGMYNYDKIALKFYDSKVEIQRLEKGDLDFLGLSPEQYVQQTKGPKWRTKKVLKVKFQNKSPKGYGFIGLNLKNELFQSKNMRLALYHLLDRDKMNKKFRFNYSRLATGPWYIQSMYANKDVEPIKYDPKKASELLKKEGWKDTDGDLILDKMVNGKKKKLSFTILNPSKQFEKYLTLYKEDAKQLGVDINIQYVEWSSFVTKLDERSFDAVTLAWVGGSVHMDPKQIWHSESAKNKGSNFISYNNPRVDKLIDEARMIIDKEKRMVKYKEIYKLIADDVPYLFLFNSDYGFYGHAKDLNPLKDTLEYEVGYGPYWWFAKP